MRRIVLALALFWLALGSFAHPGRADNLGGHYVRKSGWGYPVGSYHYHSGPYAGYIVSTKGEVPAAFKKSNTAPKGNNVLKVQERLNKLGYSCGKPDGKMGTKTKSALKAFQKDRGLKADGVIGPQTLKALGL